LVHETHARVAKFWFFALSAALWPFLVISLYLNFSHSHPSINNAVVGYSALALSVLVGAVCMHFAGIYAGWFRRASGANAAAIAMYVFFIVAALFYYSFSYVCSKFGACL
jgi:hypothetical protein